MSIHFVIPFYGEPRYLVQAVESVRRQRHRDWALTVVDDQYPSAVAEEYVTRLDDARITYQRNAKRLGPNGNTYKCSRIAEREFVCLMGADDVLEPDYAEVAIAQLRAAPSAVALHPSVTVIDGCGRVSSAAMADRVKGAISRRQRSQGSIAGEGGVRSLLMGNWLYTPSLCYRTSAIADVPYRPDIDAVHDLAFVVDLLLGGGAILLDSTPTYRYRRHRSSDSSVRARQGLRLEQERRYYEDAARQLRKRGWLSAARAAEVHLFSRLHALKVSAELLASRDLGRGRSLARQALARL